ncbi:hypothetical protein J27TS7_32870 [Paenibacillus dendritiformis]|uniref:hypothetical protein n=1 Tax=Paenibacillus dendritiformis TaxID=130049 RepID=UPI001AFF9CD5|nr:hypothetical protein [Paenibacillus dendritiformis]GIO73773.1 hypothetical protein J27TS7_32870 [Paenibacillus dendritiformis]
MDAREYVQEVELNLRTISDLQEAQQIILDNVERRLDVSDWARYLGNAATVVGLITAFSKHSEWGLATGLVGLFTSLLPNEKERLRVHLQNGINYLGTLQRYLIQNQEYDALKAKLPFLEYRNVDGTTRFVIGDGYITGVRNRGGGWNTDHANPCFLYLATFSG